MKRLLAFLLLASSWRPGRGHFHGNQHGRFRPWLASPGDPRRQRAPAASTPSRSTSRARASTRLRRATGCRASSEAADHRRLHAARREREHGLPSRRTPSSSSSSTAARSGGSGLYVTPNGGTTIAGPGDQSLGHAHASASAAAATSFRGNFVGTDPTGCLRAAQQRRRESWARPASGSGNGARRPQPHIRQRRLLPQLGDRAGLERHRHPGQPDRNRRDGDPGHSQRHRNSARRAPGT